MADLFFCPERWEPDSMISTNTASLIQVTGFSGRTSDAWQIGDWSSDWTAISSRIPIETGWLEPGMDYRFCFWLNGGENSRADEVCMLEIYGDDQENRLCFKLNRNYTKPVLQKNGWLLFAIPFTAPRASDALYFRFVMSGAVCTIAGIPSMRMSEYDTMVSDPPPAEAHAQRHNIVFPGGWPEKPKVVLKAHGKELALSKRALRITAAAAGLTAGILLVVRHHQKKK